MKKDHEKKRYIGKIIVAFLFGAAIMAFIRYISYGGMNSGTQVNNEEFLKVAEEIDDIASPLLHNSSSMTFCSVAPSS